MTHPGLFIREHVLPNDMTVVDAAKLLDIGRPALSNVLNGNAALSPELAQKIERAFEFSAATLLEMQLAFDQATAASLTNASNVRRYVPEFLAFKADDFTTWGNKIDSRSRLAVLLRILVNSTGKGLQKVDFPGNDDSQRPGWDGWIEAGGGTPWIPDGKSGWEFGTNNDPKKKANGDYAKSVKATEPDERKQTAFVFVTTQRWPQKETWANEKRALGEWKEVRAYDASDLEQWLEQSIPAQAWFASQCGVETEGVSTPQMFWADWAGVCEPALSIKLASGFSASEEKIVEDRLLGSSAETLIIKADSQGEALAFLHAITSKKDNGLAALADRLLVFDRKGTLARLAVRSSDFIPIIADEDIQKEFAPFLKSLPCVLIYPRNASAVEADITLQPMSDEVLQAGLGDMGLDPNDAYQIARETGRSLAVMRRKFAHPKLPAIRKPEWAADREKADNLIPFVFAGAWNTDNDADQTVMSILANCNDGSVLDLQFRELLLTEDAPVWSVGPVRGIVSKIGALFAIADRITPDHVGRLFDASELVLSEKDPSLELPEDQRWMAGAFGKVREVSGALREQICETVVLLSTHGETLFGNRGVHPARLANQLVCNLLQPMDIETLESHSGDLPMYAEAAPDQFLTLLEEDLQSPEPQSTKLFRTFEDGIFGSPSRTGMLWALENTAWHPDRFERSVTLLAEYAKIPLDDKWANKPIESLRSIFRSWMPQTAAQLNSRIGVLKRLCKSHPDIGWELCIDQLDIRQRVGDYNHKPRWRPDAQGHGEPLSRREDFEFRDAVIDIVKDWPALDLQHFSDLVRQMPALDEASQNFIWNRIESWAQTANDDHKAALHEEVRLNNMTRRAKRRSKDAVWPVPGLFERVRSVLKSLEPDDPVFRHRWLFEKQWVDLSADELSEEDHDYEGREKLLSRQREEALREIVDQRGLDGVSELARFGDAAPVVGQTLQTLEIADSDIETYIVQLSNEEGFERYSVGFRVIAGMLHRIGWKDMPALIKTLDRLRGQLDNSRFLLVCLACPTSMDLWTHLESLGPKVAEEYWKTVTAHAFGVDAEEKRFAANKLLKAERPFEAFHLIHYRIEPTEPSLLYRILKGMISFPVQDDTTPKFSARDVRSAFIALNESRTVSEQDMAQLEFQFIEVLDREDYPVPNLARQIADNADMFIQAVVYAYKRSDEGKDPEEYQLDDKDALKRTARACYKLLNSLRGVPGLEQADVDRAIDWIALVQTKLKALGRSAVGDVTLGGMLARTPTIKLDNGDDHWPSDHTAEIIEAVLTEDMSRGMRITLFNSRGAHWRGEGGGSERTLAEKYQRWADRAEPDYPRLAKMLSKMADEYLQLAKREDEEAAIRRRISR